MEEEIVLRPRRIKTSINKTLLKETISNEEIKNFKSTFYKFISEVERAEEQNQTEENFKNILKIFLEDSFYKNKNALNTKSYKGLNEADLVIHSDKTQDSNVSVIIEVKKPKNISEMLSKDIIKNPNVKNLCKKSFLESVLYFLWESVDKENIELKNIIITNIYEYFIFDASYFKKVFLDKNSKLINTFKKWRDGQLIDSKTDTMYSEIEKYILSHESHFKNFRFTYFDLKDLKNDESNLDILYKVFSDKHLLKQVLENDSNTLNKDFYNELLYIIGLEEVDKGGQKLIQRKKSPDVASLLENSINTIDDKDKLDNLTNKAYFGASKPEIIFNVSLSLCIRWINRILFLKLLEGQLYKYHNFDKSYKFLESDKIKDFNSMNKLFFSVLARKTEDRKEEIQKEFFRVPYLNSSLFEITTLENDLIDVSSLDNSLELPVYKSTVLKDAKGKKLTGKVNTLNYLLDFLGSYDFGAEENSENLSKTLINASVLGLIFEKINGYKDGSFYTPSFITTYMCRESISKAIIQKFNDKYSWKCETIEDLEDKIENKKEANELINSLKICDPAVGSGHFLVSALNEIIAIKSELGVLFDTEGKRLKDYRIENYNDELLVTDEDDEFFEYKVSKHDDFHHYVERKISKEKTRIQKALFFEKKNLIENCLFGVDINNNSVMICRLRLWIELLKNTFYTEDSEYKELETLPNIDINIKQGNSLISRYDISENLSNVFNKKGFSSKEYKQKVKDYKETNDKKNKKDLLDYFKEIKNKFETVVSDRDLGEIQKAENEFKQLESNMFGIDKDILKAKRNKLNKLIERKEEIESNLIYQNAFEWRFEFPEVLDENGEFVGFDIIIGNPPYMRVQEINRTQPNEKTFYEGINSKNEKRYINASASYDLANLFFELALKISSNESYNSFIFPHKFFNSSSTEIFRNYLSEGKYIKKISHFGANMIFEDADTYTCIAQFGKKKTYQFLFQRFPFKSDFQRLMLDEDLYSLINYEMINKASEYYGSNQWILFDNKKSFDIFEKIYNKSKTLEDCFEDIFQGLATSKDELYVLDKISESEETFTFKIPISNKIYDVEKTFFKPFILGRDVHRYSNLNTNKYVFFPYELDYDQAKIISLEKLKSDYPLTYNYVIDHEKEFKARESGKAGKMNNWIAYIYPKNLTKFEKIKLSSMEICSKHPNVTLNTQNFYHPTTVYSWLKKENTIESYEYFLSIANSKIMWWFLKLTGDTLQGDARRLKTNYLNPFPIPMFVDKEYEGLIKSLVDEILEKKKEGIDTTDLENKIDQMVYKLYDLTEKEIKIVEGV
jgi:adenine-specific DNA-methyltransferase